MSSTNVYMLCPCGATFMVASSSLQDVRAGTACPVCTSRAGRPDKRPCAQCGDTSPQHSRERINTTAGPLIYCGPCAVLYGNVTVSQTTVYGR